MGKGEKSSKQVKQILIWRLFVTNCAVLENYIECAAVQSAEKEVGGLGLGLLQKIEGTRMKHSRQIKGVSSG